MRLYQALEEDAELNSRSKVDIMQLNNSIVNRTEELIKNSHMGHGAQRNNCQSLEKVLSFLREKKFILHLQQWQNPIKRPKDTQIKLDKESKGVEQDKCPSDFQMLQVAEAFRRATTPRQKYFTSLCVMLMCQPSRQVELNGLTINSLQKSDKDRWYLMWHPAKGGDPVRKWIPKLLEDIVQQAFKRLVSISKPARNAAKFAHDNPREFMVHDQCITPTDYPQDVSLTYDKFAKASGLRVGLTTRGVKLNWRNATTANWYETFFNNLNNVANWRTLPPEEVVYPTYQDLRKQVDQNYKHKTFPLYGDMKIWECLTLTRESEFHKAFSVKSFSWRRLTHGILDKALQPSVISMVSIFEELELMDEDGSPLSLTSHQFRHWLETKLQLAGEDDWIIAKWSGRADIQQNKDYDGRTAAQKSRLTKRIGHVIDESKSLTVGDVNTMLSQHSADNPPPPLVLHDLSLPVSLKSLGVKRDGVAQFTGLGYCVHNYAESPCSKNADCATCGEHVCMKGIGNSLDELKSFEMLLSEQLEHAQASTGEGVYGADRWVTSLGFRLSKIRTIIRVLEDPNNEDGTTVRIPDELDPSPVKRSLGKGTSDPNLIPTFDLTALALTDMEE